MNSSRAQVSPFPMWMVLLIVAIVAGMAGEQAMVEMGYPGGPLAIAGFALVSLAGYTVVTSTMHRAWRRWH